jgi:shikimate kinase
MKKPLFLIGFMGAGKTTVGQLLAEKLKFKFIDLDENIEKITGKTIVDFFAENREENFRTLESNLLKNIAKKRKINNYVVALGGGTPCFPQNLEIIKAGSTSFYLKWTNENLLTRLKIDGIDKRPLLCGKTDEELRLFISESMSYREKFYSQANFIIEGKDDEEMAQKIGEITQTKFFPFV